MIQIFDSWAGHLEPSDFDVWASPYQRRVVEAIKARHPEVPIIIYMAPDAHSRGGALLERLASSGADVVSVDHTIEIGEAKRRLAAWGSKPPDWSIGCAGLLKLLGSAASLAFPFTSTAVPEPGFWGLWTESPTAGGPSAQFASGDVSADLSFAHALTFAPTPGDWYVSSALALAHATRSGPPWPSGSDVTWNSTFGPDGTMPRTPGFQTTTTPPAATCAH